jgi:hypothetical protein
LAHFLLWLTGRPEAEWVDPLAGTNEVDGEMDGAASSFGTTQVMLNMREFIIRDPNLSWIVRSGQVSGLPQSLQPNTREAL